MSIEQKLLTIEENQPKVFDAAVIKYAVKKTSDKSDFITVTDSAEYDILEFGMDGKTEQVQYSGKNLFDGQMEIGSISIETGKNVTNNAHMRSVNYISVVASNTYVISFKGTSKTVAVRFYDSDKIFTKTVTLSSPFAFTAPDGCSYCRFFTIGTDTTDIQLELGNTATEYEPYVGGIPSPNPDYPQEIVNAGKVGKNLFDENKLSNGEFVEFNGARCYKYVDGVKYFIYRDIFNVSTQYTITCNAYRENGITYTIYLTIVYSDGSSKQTAIKPGEITTVMSEEGKTIDYIRGSDNYGQAVYLDLSVIQIEEGTAATDYEPYGTYNIECTTTGKNFFDNKWITGFININTGEDTSSAVSLRSDYIELPQQSFIVSGLSSYITYILTYDQNKQFMRYLGMNANKVTMQEGEKYIRIGLYNSTVIPEYTQIELGTTATEYVPYQSPQSFTLTSTQPLSKWDKLVKRDGVWGWSVNTHKDIYTGAESWTAYGANVVRYAFEQKPIHHTSNAAIGTKCEHFIETALPSQTVANNTFTSCHDGTEWIIFHVGKSVADWKAYLAEQYANGTPVYIMYPTESEQSFIPLPDEEQELLNNLETYYGGTNMYNDQGCPMWIKYIVDPETLQ